MKGYVTKPLTLRSIGGHDVLLDTAHDSIVESSCQHNRNLLGHTLTSVELIWNGFGCNPNMREFILKNGMSWD